MQSVPLGEIRGLSTCSGRAMAYIVQQTSLPKEQWPENPCKILNEALKDKPALFRVQCDGKQSNNQISWQPHHKRLATCSADGRRGSTQFGGSTATARPDAAYTRLKPSRGCANDGIACRMIDSGMVHLHREGFHGKRRLTAAGSHAPMETVGKYVRGNSSRK